MYNNYDFISAHKSMIDKMDRMYAVPDQKEFLERRFARVKWTNSRQRNFYTIIRVLAERGPCTIGEIVMHDSRPLGKNDLTNRYGLYRRIIAGDKNTKAVGLVERGILSPIESGSKKTKRYGLSLHGIFIALRVFTPHQLVSSSDPFGFLEYDRTLGTRDFSRQSAYPEFIVDVLARNYPDSLPMLFGKWPYLKSHPRIDVYKLCYIAVFIRDYDHKINPNINANSKFSYELNKFENNITAEFFASQLQMLGYELSVFVDSLDAEEKKFLDMIIYSYVRLNTENYHRAMYFDSLYKGDDKSAERHRQSLIDGNDLLENKEDARDNRNPYRGQPIDLGPW